MSPWSFYCFITDMISVLWALCTVRQTPNDFFGQRVALIFGAGHKFWKCRRIRHCAVAPIANSAKYFAKMHFCDKSAPTLLANPRPLFFEGPVPRSCRSFANVSCARKKILKLSKHHSFRVMMGLPKKMDGRCSHPGFMTRDMILFPENEYSPLAD